MTSSEKSSKARDVAEHRRSAILSALLLLAALVGGAVVGVFCIAPSLRISPALAALVMTPFLLAGVTFWQVRRLQLRVEKLSECIALMAETDASE